MIHDQSFTTLGKKSHFEGTLKLNGPTHLLGSFKGELTIESQSLLVLEIGSLTEGIIVCDHLEIYGEFTGEIRATGVVTLYPTCSVNGKIIAKGLEILPGAQVNMNGHTEELNFAAK